MTYKYVEPSEHDAGSNSVILFFYCDCLFIYYRLYNLSTMIIILANVFYTCQNEKNTEA